MFFDSFLVKSLTDYSLNIVGKVVMASTLKLQVQVLVMLHIRKKKGFKVTVSFSSMDLVSEANILINYFM